MARRRITPVVICSLALAACSVQEPTSPDRTDQPDATPTATASASPPSPTAADDGSPTESPDATEDGTLASDQAVAIDPQRRGLVLIAVPDGQVVAQLDADLGPTGLGEGAGSLEYSAARSSVLLSRVVTGARQEIVEVQLGDGDAQVIRNGHTAAVSSDGRRLAVGRRTTDASGTTEVVLEARTFAGQIIGRWADEVRQEEPVRISDVSWSPDATQLAFELGFEDGTEVRTLDVDAEDGSLQASSREVEPTADLRMLSAPTFRPTDGALVAVEGPGLDPEAEQRWRIVAFEPGPGAVVTALVATDRAVTLLDFDRTGTRLLYVEGHGHPSNDGAAAPPVLYSWADESATRVAEGLAHASW